MKVSPLTPRRSPPRPAHPVAPERRPPGPPSFGRDEFVSPRKYNQQHNKRLFDVPLVSSSVARRDGTGMPLSGGPKSPNIVDRKASVDLTTLTPNGMILAFHKTAKGKPAGEGSSMIRVSDIAKPFRSRVVRMAREVAKRERSGQFAGSARRVLTVTPGPIPEGVAQKFKFISSAGKPVGRMKDFAEFYGEGVQVGTWTTPGNGTVGAGGIRTFLRAGQQFHTSRVAPVVVRDANPQDGVSGSATFVYGYVVSEGRRQYLWTMQSARWAVRRNGRVIRTGGGTYLR